MPNANGIDKIDLHCLHFAMRNVGNVPLPPVEREIYDYKKITNNGGDGRLVMFFIMKVKLNVKIFKTDEEYTSYFYKMRESPERNIDRIHYPVLIEHPKERCSLKDLKNKLNWYFIKYHVPQGPALTWIMVFPGSHFFCLKFKEKGGNYVPLPYKWLGLNEDSVKENANTESFITQVISNTIVPFYACVYFTNPSFLINSCNNVIANTLTKYWERKVGKKIRKEL